MIEGANLHMLILVIVTCFADRYWPSADKTEAVQVVLRAVLEMGIANIEEMPGFTQQVCHDQRNLCLIKPPAAMTPQCPAS